MAVLLPFAKDCLKLRLHAAFRKALTGSHIIFNAAQQILQGADLFPATGDRVLHIAGQRREILTDLRIVFQKVI